MSAKPLTKDDWEHKDPLLGEGNADAYGRWHWRMAATIDQLFECETDGIAYGREVAGQPIDIPNAIHITSDYPGGGCEPANPDRIVYNGVTFYKDNRASLEFVAEMALLHTATLFAQGARVIDAKLSAITLVNKYLAALEAKKP